jgi:hypothetical protein
MKKYLDEKLFENLPVLNQGINKPIISKKNIIEKLNKHEDTTIGMDKAVSYDPTTKLFSNKDRTVSMRNYNDADAYNRAMGIKKDHYSKEATPEQFGKLAERLERTRKQQGRPTKVGEFEKAFNKVKKPIKKSTPIKIDIPFVSIPAPIAVRRDPQQELRTQRFNKMVEDSEREKLREQSSGLASFLGKKFI